MTQPTLFDAPPPQVARDRAIARVEANGDPRWQAAAREALETLCRMRREFTADDIWDYLAHHGLPAPDEPRLLGPVMKRAVSDGLIEATDRVVNSRRGHAGIKRIWRAL